ncbi:CRISPR-associated helicase Cas3 [Minicystis rosea]|nr:CRISPR-associated helicase Cas3 [Minicystis rosea]
MASLSPADFSAYFQAIHGSAPFPWQARLLERVAREEGEWPALLNLPTGTGKTAALDVAIFHLALDPAKAPRRIVLVVDRRTVVDQAFTRAQKIAKALEDAEDGVLKVVADRLRNLVDDDERKQPVAVAQLRGGVPRDDGWARRPDQPVLAISTVDQVGSRLLFRGYGVSEAMRPIHAGLLGNDTLFLLDEVHLSLPFRDSLRKVARYRGWGSGGLPNRFHVVEMSATPGEDTQRAFHLEESDRRDAKLARRLGARKPARVAEPSKRSAFEKDCAEEAAKLAGPGRAVGVVVNRVATARGVHALLRQKLGEKARLFLVTGRMRPLDRDALDEALREHVGSDRDRKPAAVPAPIVVVSTQCIEAGADLDFDALVTECAPLDALRQRFGRLDRLGVLGHGTGVVLASEDSIGKNAKDDPIYGAALKKTWQWLGKGRDFGIDALQPELPAGEALAELLTQRAYAPVMLPAHLDLWTQTMPPPRPDPDVALFLHGMGREQEAEVRIVWRADVSAALLAAAKSEPAAYDALLDRIEVCPPLGLEALSLPLSAARAWLSGAAEPALADVEGPDAEMSNKSSEERRATAPAKRPALLWRGEDSEVVEPHEIPPGATLVVPSTYGGINDHGAWEPSSKTSVTDLGDHARWKQTRRATLRLHEAVLGPGWTNLPKPAGEDDEDDDRKVVRKWLEERESDAGEPWQREVLEALEQGKRRLAIVRVATFEKDEGYLALVARGPALGESITEGDGGSYTGVEKTLDEHMKGVADWARSFAKRCGLPDTLVRDLELAGRWHDAGKVDPRFQRLLHGGSAYKAEVAPEPLAKSKIVLADREAREQARKRSGYPKGARHELSSVALLTAHASLLASAHDRDLVLHLVASHHGHCRPFAPVAPDHEPVILSLRTDEGVVTASSDHGLARLDAGVPERFFRLVEKYGWFGLAWLEAILRLADHRRSEEEQRMEETR